MQSAMKKLFLAIFTLFTMSVVTQAGELESAYQKEYAFLKAQKAELEKRLESDKVQQANELQASKEKVEALQAKLLEVSEKGTIRFQYFTRYISSTTN